MKKASSKYLDLLINDSMAMEIAVKKTLPKNMPTQEIFVTQVEPTVNRGPLIEYL